jgi:hypothetical protein
LTETADASDVVSPSLLDVANGQEDGVIANEIHIIYLQQKLYLKQSRWLNLPSDSNARRHLDVKLGALKYKIEKLEKHNFQNIYRAQLDSTAIREEAERLYIRNLRENVFLNKKLIVIPRPKKIVRFQQ